MKVGDKSVWVQDGAGRAASTGGWSPAGRGLMWCGCATVIVVLAVSPVGAQFGPPTVVALEGDQAPGEAPGVTFSHIYSPPVIGHSDRLTILTNIAGSGIPYNTRGAWVGEAGAWTKIYRAGDLVSDELPGLFVKAAYPRSCDGDQVFSYVLAEDSSAVQHEVWLIGRPGDLTVVIQQNVTQPPNTDPGAVFAWFQSYSISRSCSVLSAWQLSGPGIHASNSSGLYLVTQSGITEVAREHQPAPGTSLSFDDFTIGSIHLSVIADDGSLAMITPLRDANFNSAGTGLFAGQPGALEVVVKTGDPAPGGGTFTALRELSNRFLGTLAFLGEVDGLGSIWTIKKGVMAEVARVGRPSPDGSVFSEFDGVSVNRHGRVAFRARTAANGVLWGVYSDVDGQLRLFAGRGIHPPGTDAAVTYSDLLSHPRLTDDGQFAFLATCSQSGGGIDLGLWARDWTGETSKVVLEGEMIEVAPGDLREVGRYSGEEGALLWGVSTTAKPPHSVLRAGWHSCSASATAHMPLLCRLHQQSSSRTDSREEACWPGLPQLPDTSRGDRKAPTGRAPGSRWPTVSTPARWRSSAAERRRSPTTP